MADRNFFLILGLVFLLLVVITVFDIFGVNLYLPYCESMPYEVCMEKEILYWSVFWGMTVVMGIVVSVIYYLFRRDGSESMALAAGYYFIIMTGLEDILYFLFQGQALPQNMYYLFKYPTPQSLIDRLLGHSTVTPGGLILSVLAWTVVGILVVYALYHYTPGRHKH